VEPLDLTGYQPFWVARAELLVRAERPAEARQAFDRALALTENAVEHAHLTSRRASV